MLGNIVPHTSDVRVLRGERGIMLLLPVDLRGEKVVFRLERTALRHAAHGKIQKRVRRDADQHCGNDISGARKRHLGQAHPEPPEQQQILAERKQHIQRPFAAVQPVFIAVHEQHQHPQQKRVETDADRIGGQLLRQRLQGKARVHLFRRENNCARNKICDIHENKTAQRYKEYPLPLVAEEQEKRQNDRDQRINDTEDRPIRHKIRRNDPDEVLDDKAENRDRHGKPPRQRTAEGCGPHREEQSVDSDKQRRILSHKMIRSVQVMSKMLRVTHRHFQNYKKSCIITSCNFKQIILQKRSKGKRREP